MWNKLWKILSIGKHELPRVQFLWGLRFAFQVGFIWAWVITTSIFIDVFGADKLLYLFLVEAWIVLLGSIAAHWCYIKLPQNTFFLGNALGVLLMLGIAFVMQDHAAWFFACLLIAKNIFYTQLNIAIYRRNESLFSPVEAQNHMPVIDSALTIGSILGSLIFLNMLEVAPPKTLIFFWVFPILTLLWLWFVTSRKLAEIPQLSSEDEPSLPKHYLHQSFTALKKVPFLRVMVLVIMLQSALFAIADYEFLSYVSEKADKQTHLDHQLLQANMFANTALKESYDEALVAVQTIDDAMFAEKTVAQYLGILSLCFGLIALGVQGLLASRILKRLGVVHTMVFFFATYIGFALAFFFGGISMKIVKGYQHGFHVLFDAAYHVSFYSIFSHRREVIRHFLEGLVRPLGVILGVTLVVALQAITASPGALAMILLTCALTLLLIPMRHFFTFLSHDNLSSDRNMSAKLHSIEVLGQKGHHQQVQILCKELLRKDLNPILRNKIVHTLGQVNQGEAIHAFIKILGDHTEDHELKIQILETTLKMDSLKKYWRNHAFTRKHWLDWLQQEFETTDNHYARKLIIMNTFAHMQSSQIAEYFLARLGEEDDEIKAICLRSAGEIFADPEVVYYLRKYLNHESAKLRGYAIIALWKFEESCILRTTIDEMLVSIHEEELIAAIYAIGETEDIHYEAQLFDLLDHPNDAVHFHTLIALAKLGNEFVVPEIIELLFESDEATSHKCFNMLKRAESIRDILKKEIQYAVSERVCQIMIQSQIKAPRELGRLDAKTRKVIRHWYQLAEKYDEILVLESV